MASCGPEFGIRGIVGPLSEPAIEDDGVPLDFTIFTQLHYCLSEYNLAIGDLDQARTSADRLRDHAAPAPDLNHLALAHGLLARIAFASGDRQGALDQLSLALSIVEDADLPLPKWRVYKAANEIFSGVGNSSEASKYKNRFSGVLLNLSKNFDAEDPLHGCLLTALAAACKCRRRRAIGETVFGSPDLDGGNDTSASSRRAQVTFPH